MSTMTAPTKAEAQGELEQAWAAMPHYFRVLHLPPQVCDEEQGKAWVRTTANACQHQLVVVLDTAYRLQTYPSHEQWEVEQMREMEDAHRRLLAALEGAERAMGWK